MTFFELNQLILFIVDVKNNRWETKYSWFFFLNEFSLLNFETLFSESVWDLLPSPKLEQSKNLLNFQCVAQEMVFPEWNCILRTSILLELTQRISRSILHLYYYALEDIVAKMRETIKQKNGSYFKKPFQNTNMVVLAKI